MRLVSYLIVSNLVILQVSASVLAVERPKTLNAASLMSCLQFPREQSLNAKVIAATCGEGAERKVRIPSSVSLEVLNRWDVLSRSGIPGAAEEMFKTRQMEIDIEGTIDLPVKQ